MNTTLANAQREWLRKPCGPEILLIMKGNFWHALYESMCNYGKYWPLSEVYGELEGLYERVQEIIGAEPFISNIHSLLVHPRITWN